MSTVRIPDPTSQDLAKGIMLAQMSQKPAVPLRELVGSRAMQSVPYELRMEALRDYVDMAGRPEYRDRLSERPALKDDVLDTSKDVAGGAARGAMIGLAASVMTDRGLLDDVMTMDRSNLNRNFNRLKARARRPVVAAGLIGAALEGYGATKGLRERNNYLNTLEPVLDKIRTKENPNPYINALLMTSTKDMEQLQEAMREDRESLRDTSTKAQTAAVRSALLGTGFVEELIHSSISDQLKDYKLDDLAPDMA